MQGVDEASANGEPDEVRNVREIYPKYSSKQYATCYFTKTSSVNSILKSHLQGSIFQTFSVIFNTRPLYPIAIVLL